MSTSVSPRVVHFAASDGIGLVGDLAVPSDPVGAAIICHPHPQYGGNRFNNVVTALFDALPAAGIAALRFDFRSPFTGGTGEHLDALGALDALAVEVPGAGLAAIGYSFGAMVAHGLRDERVSSLVLIAAPLAMAPDVLAPTVPTLVLTPAHDQFSPPELTEPIVAGWTAARVDRRTIEMADHSLVGHTAAIADAVTSWLRT